MAFIIEKEIKGVMAKYCRIEHWEVDANTGIVSVVLSWYVNSITRENNPKNFLKREVRKIEGLNLNLNMREEIYGYLATEIVDNEYSKWVSERGVKTDFTEALSDA